MVMTANWTVNRAALGPGSPSIFWMPKEGFNAFRSFFLATGVEDDDGETPSMIADCNRYWAADRDTNERTSKTRVKRR